MMVVMDRPVMVPSGPTLDAADPIAVAEFYERLLGWPIARREGPHPGNPPNDGWAMLRSPEDRGVMAISIQWEPDYVAPVWPPMSGARSYTATCVPA